MAENDGEKSSSTSPLVLVLLLVNGIFLGAVGYLQYKSMKMQSEKPSVSDLVQEYMDGQGSAESRSELLSEQKKEGALLPLDSFTVNLAQGKGPRRYLRLKMVLKFNKDSKDDEFQAKKPQIRDSIISILNSKRPEDLLQREGKLYLKEEIKNGINGFLVNGAVVDLFYVSFQIN